MAINHDSDCSVHNDPAMPKGKCDCGAQARHERRYAAWLCQLGCKALFRLRIRIASPLWTLSSTAKTGAMRALSRYCLYLLFGSRVVKGYLQLLRQAGTAQQHDGGRHT